MLQNIVLIINAGGKKIQNIKYFKQKKLQISKFD